MKGLEEKGFVEHLQKVTSEHGIDVSGLDKKAVQAAHATINKELAEIGAGVSKGYSR